MDISLSLKPYLLKIVTFTLLTTIKNPFLNYMGYGKLIYYGT